MKSNNFSTVLEAMISTCALCFLLSTGIQTATSSSVTLSSSLNGRSTAYPQQVITFTCITKGSQILAWSSDEYIGQSHQLEFTSISLQGIMLSRGTTFATLISVRNEDERIVLESTLQITASSLFPSSSVACHLIDGRMNSTNFHVANVLAQEVNNTLRQGLYACPGDRQNFICETRDSEILAWSSDEYIGRSSLLEFTFLDSPGTPLYSANPNTIAVLTNVSRENGVLVITCNLSIIVLPSIDHRGHSVTCINVGIGTRNITTFQLADNCGQTPDSTTETMRPLLIHHWLPVGLTSSGMVVCSY